MIPTPILKLIGALLVGLSLLGYISVLRSDNKALEASVELHKQQLEHAVLVANDNTQKYLYLQERNSEQNKKLLLLQQNIDVLKEEQKSSETEVIKYVTQLPEGLEKACLNMRVNTAISGVSEH